MKLGEESWTYVDKYKQLVFVDVLYFKGQVLAIDYRSGLVLTLVPIKKTYLRR